MQLIFSFDTEEYETPGVDDAVKVWADMLTKHGCRGAFCLVGEKARVLRKRGRKDILDALAPHEIDFHSNHHSEHPLHAEYLDEMGWDDGVQRILEEEAPGIRDVETITGERPFAYCKPGTSWSPQVAHAMSLLGLPVFCDAPFEFAPGKPLWYCNHFFFGYHTGFDRYFDTPNRLQQMKTDFRNLCDQIGEDGTIVMYTHPVRLFTQKFADNFRYGHNTPKDQWVPAPLRAKSQIDELIRDFDAFVGHVVAEGIQVIDYRQLYAQYRQTPTWIGLPILIQLAQNIQQELTYHIVDNTSFSPAEIFGAIVFVLDEHQHTGNLPEHIPIRPLIGPTQAPKHECPTEPVDTNLLLNPIAHLNTNLDRVPAAIVLNHKAIAPGPYLKAIASILEAIASQQPVPIHLSLNSNWTTPAFAQRKALADVQFTWSMFYPGFEGKNVIELARLQAWTAKPALKA